MFGNARWRRWLESPGNWGGNMLRTNLRVMLLGVLLLGVQLLACSVQARSATVELYVGNMPFPGDYRLLRDNVYGDLLALLRMTEQVWALDDNRLLIAPERRKVMRNFRVGGGGRVVRAGGLTVYRGEEASADRDVAPVVEGAPVYSCPPLSEDTLVLVYEGVPIDLAQESFGGKIYVSVEKYARLLGDSFTWNRELGVADYWVRNDNAAYRWLTTLEKGGRPSAAYPLELTGFQYDMVEAAWHPTRTMLGYVSVRNVASRPLKGVKLCVELYDGGGNCVGRVSQVWEAVAAGEEFTWQLPLWTNFTGATEVRPAVCYCLNASKEVAGRGELAPFAACDLRLGGNRD